VGGQEKKNVVWVMTLFSWAEEKNSKKEG